jgi:hypothetical protein
MSGKLDVRLQSRIFIVIFLVFFALVTVLAQGDGNDSITFRLDSDKSPWNEFLKEDIEATITPGTHDCGDSQIFLQLDSEKSPWNEFLKEDVSITVVIPRIVVLANSIDSQNAPDFARFLNNRGFEVLHSSALDFQSCKEEALIMILGGPDAPESVGDIVQEALNEVEEESIREKGSKKMYVKGDIWATGQTVIVIAVV